MPGYDVFQTPDYNLQAIQARMAAFAEAFRTRNYDGTLIEGVEFTAGQSKQVSHGLKRPAKGVAAINVKSRPCAFSAYLGADQTSVSGSATSIQINTEWFDLGGDFDTATYTFTAPETGNYEFLAKAYWSSIGDGQYAQLQLNYNGTNTWPLALNFNGATAGMCLNGTIAVPLSESDTITLESSHNATTPDIFGGVATLPTTFSGRNIGSPLPYFDASVASADYDPSVSIPVYAERKMTCDLWVY